jgi:CheY-like chemotaxis protein
MKKILVIDDERPLTELLRHVLSGNGYRVDTAFNGLEGLGKLKDFQPDLVVLDVNMPQMDGWQFLATLRASPVTRGIRVIMCTERNLIKEIERATELGAQGYIFKPFQTDRVLKKIAEVLAAPVR